MIKQCPNCQKEIDLLHWGVGRLLHCQDCHVLQFYSEEGKPQGNAIYSESISRISRLKRKN